MFRQLPMATFMYSILDVKAKCKNCKWIGTVKDCEPDDDGELTCPKCLTIIVVRVPEAGKFNPN